MLIFAYTLCVVVCALRVGFLRFVLFPAICVCIVVSCINSILCACFLLCVCFGRVFLVVLIIVCVVCVCLCCLWCCF